MTGDAWDPRQYDRFAAERRQPFRDLVALVQPRPGLRVVDLGCGTGSTTRELHEALGARETVGVERSAAMLGRPPDVVGLQFRAGDIADFSGVAEWDVVFSNAALHWIPSHADLFARLADALRADGQLAVQVPANHDQAPRLAAVAVGNEEPFRSALGGWQPPVHVLTPDGYARLLDAVGFREQHVRLQVYAHRLGSRLDVVEWMKGTTLTAWRERLTPGMYGMFVERYAERLAMELPDDRPFFFPFQRILIWGRR